MPTCCGPQTVLDVPGRFFGVSPVTLLAADAVQGGYRLVATAALPAGTRISMVLYQCTASFGTTLGLTSVDIGEPDMQDRWGQHEGITFGTLTRYGDGLSGDLDVLVDGDVWVTAIDGPFDATGSCKIIVFWERVLPDGTFDNTGLLGLQGETGLTGPQGPVGPAGPRGPAGGSVAGRTFGTTTVSLLAADAEASAQRLVAPAALTAGDRIAMVVYQCTTAFETSLGLTGVEIGTAAHQSRWGTAVGIVEGTTTDYGDSVGSDLVVSVDTDVWVSAIGGPFTTEGACTVTVLWERVTL